MKATVIVAVLLAAFAIALPFVVLRPSGEAGENISSEGNENTANEPENSGQSKPEPEPSPVTVDVLMEDGSIAPMDLEEYLKGVVAAEMPASFELEALKAQAVAARTYTLYKMWVQPSQNHPDADVCTDYNCCKAYSSPEKLTERWGDSYEENSAKIAQAVDETWGEYMVYEDEPVLAVFHSSSAGATENSADVWGGNVPYLVSVQSPEDESQVTNYVADVTVSFEEFESTVKETVPDAVFPEDKNAWITDIVYTESGRIDTLNVGGVTIKGTQLRSMFSLRSTAVTVQVGESGITFTSTGYGHGVGMSQYGANAMALEGSGYRDILTWYYTGVGFANLEE